MSAWKPGLLANAGRHHHAEAHRDRNDHAADRAGASESMIWMPRYASLILQRLPVGTGARVALQTLIDHTQNQYRLGAPLPIA